MRHAEIKLWQKAPVIRLLLPFVLGILVQWHAQLSILYLCFIGTVLIISVAGYRLINIKHKFFLGFIFGFVINLLLFTGGALVTYLQDVRKETEWIGNKYLKGDAVVLTIQEPLVEKAASFKALARVDGLYKGKLNYLASGQVIVYFNKKDTITPVGYGTQIILTKPLQEITNSGNPGAFDYRRYALFNGITHQVYLTTKDYIILSQNNITAYKSLLYRSRAAIIGILKKYIKGEKEQGLAEALLIGYKDDLDKKLVEAYSNTGVVHVIAISGLHLGIIYWILLWITAPLNNKKSKWLRFIIILAGLWSFSLLAGAQPSVLRSAVMFSAIALSSVLNRQSSIYNTLALSAFGLLCWNPYWLWDVGFQLSYMAVLSIILFFRPVYNWFYFPNKALDFIWKLMAVSLAAQVLTLPISVYHFHQFPFVFLFANLVAVPLSSVILIGEISLCIVAFIPPGAQVIGTILFYSINWMNAFVERLDKIPFSVWENLSISPIQAGLLYCIIAAGAFWLLERRHKSLVLLLCCMSLFMMLRSISFLKAYKQQKLIVYNVPRHQAIDVIKGRKFLFVGDAALAKDDFLRNFHIQPSRVLHRIKEVRETNVAKSFSFKNKQILIVDTTVVFSPKKQKPVVDILVLSKNPGIYIPKVAENAYIRQVVADGSVPAWKAKLWKKDCDSLRIPFFDVTVNGAFVVDF